MKKLIDHYTLMVNEQYEQTEDEFMEEVKTVRFSATTTIENQAMLDALSSGFFKTSRAQVVQEILRIGVYRIFDELKPEDRKRISEAADQTIEDFYKSNLTKYERVGLKHWESVNYAKEKPDADS